MLRRSFALVVLASATLSVSACRAPASDGVRERRELPAVSESQLESLPPRATPDPRKHAIGKRLFSDVRLSGDEKVSCVTCHLREFGYTDGRAKAPKMANRDAGTVNVPSLLNVAYDYRYNWSGQYLTLEDQLDELIKRRGAMNTTWAVVVPRIAQDGDYQATFREVYPEGITRTTIADALLTYVRSLTTQGSRFDRYQKGDLAALSEKEKEGLRYFKDYGCSSCHQGRNIGGNLLQRFGVVEDYFQSAKVRDRGGIQDPDFGLFNATKDEKDRFVFRVPSLRDVARTPPYFHDGSAETLEAAVATMAYYQLGRQLSDHELSAIVAFLHTLTGEEPSP